MKSMSDYLHSHPSRPTDWIAWILCGLCILYSADSVCESSVIRWCGRYLWSWSDWTVWTDIDLYSDRVREPAWLFFLSLPHITALPEGLDSIQPSHSITRLSFSYVHKAHSMDMYAEYSRWLHLLCISLFPTTSFLFFSWNDPRWLLGNSSIILGML